MAFHPDTYTVIRDSLLQLDVRSNAHYGQAWASNVLAELLLHQDTVSPRNPALHPVSV